MVKSDLDGEDIKYELAHIRERERRTQGQYWPEGSPTIDRRTLLRFIDALQTRFLPLLSEHSRYSTALETISAMGCDGDGAGDTCSCASCRADEALTGSEELSEISVREKEIVHLRKQRTQLLEALERIVNDAIDPHGDAKLPIEQYDAARAAIAAARGEVTP